MNKVNEPAASAAFGSAWLRSAESEGLPDVAVDDLANSLAELAQLPFGRMPLDLTLTRVAQCAALAVPGADGAGLALLNDGRLSTVAATAEFVEVVDAVQHDLGQGPLSRPRFAAMSVSVAPCGAGGNGCCPPSPCWNNTQSSEAAGPTDKLIETNTPKPSTDNLIETTDTMTETGQRVRCHRTCQQPPAHADKFGGGLGLVS